MRETLKKVGFSLPLRDKRRRKAPVLDGGGNPTKCRQHIVLEFATCRYGILRLLFHCSGWFRISFRGALEVDTSTGRNTKDPDVWRLWLVRVFMIFVSPLLAWEYREYTTEKRNAWKRVDMCGRWKDKRMISFMIYIYSCLCRLYRDEQANFPQFRSRIPYWSESSLCLILAV